MGRGSSKASGGSGVVAALKGVSGYNVTFNGEDRQYFFEKHDDVTYYKTSINDIGEPTPNNMTETQMVNRMKENGASVNSMSKSELTKLYKGYQDDRKKTNEILNLAYVQDKTMKRGSRTNRIGTRVRRRKR